MLYPLTFHPIFKERVWGNRKIEQLYHKPLPPKVSIGESWEISDHGKDVSVIANGPLAGKTLHWLVQNHARDLLGDVKPLSGHFPLLIKILDAQQKLSLQVHPPPEQAAKLGGEPKTEMWYIAEAAPGAELYVGLKRSVTREQFEQTIKDGTVADCFHRIPVKAGDAMFLPSGRVHSIGAGLVIFEIQQNSDTTYRVFDWNRVGLDGNPRALHIRESLASINFNDIEPNLIQTQFKAKSAVKTRPLVRDPLFNVEVLQTDTGASISLAAHTMQILGVLSGQLAIPFESSSVRLEKGQFCLIPACLPQVIFQAPAASLFLRIWAD